LRFFLGTFAPFSRASLSPIAIACFRLRTFRPDPLLRVPFFFRCMADFTRLPAAFPYLAMRQRYAKRVLASNDLESMDAAEASPCLAKQVENDYCGGRVIRRDDHRLSGAPPLSLDG